MSARAVAGAFLVLAPLVLSGCLSDDVAGSAENVFTLQRGTMSELRRRRGRGPMRTYDRPPTAMLEVIEKAARKARGPGGEPVRAIFVSELRGEVVAKERAPEEAASVSYGAPFRSAMLAVVHPVRGRPGASRVEIHAVQRGPLHQGAVAWERDMPRWIDEVLAEEGEPLRTIP